MTVCNHVLRNTYRDSVVLMRLSRELESQPDVTQATAMMATPNNRDLLRAAGLLVQAGEAATPNDLIIAIELKRAGSESAVLAAAEALLAGSSQTSIEADDYRPRSLEGAISALPGANLALISLPGEYAATEARRALDRGLHVLLFSDNVSMADEVSLKQHALQQGLLMLGPDCGTTILQGIPLGFANAVPRGRVGLVSASGTGLQQVTCLLAASGEGISQALGVGGRDMSDAVGGLMMLKCLRLLQEDEATELVVLISKLPGPETTRNLMQVLQDCSKPCVLAFLGAEPLDYGSNVYVEPTLQDATNRVLSLTGHRPDPPESALKSGSWQQLERLSSVSNGSRFIRGLFSGGTLCYEALWILQQGGLTINSNLALEGAALLQDPDVSRGHTVVDLGDDRYTVGRPHPMIDFRPRCRRLLQEAQDPEVGVILLDVVLGFGSHPDPASELAPSIGEAIEIAENDGRDLAFVVSLCGTDADPQSMSAHEESLTGAGAIVVRSNAVAARIAMAIAQSDLSLVSRS